MENNQLEALPEDVAELFALREVYCGNNRLQAIPEGICWCSHLEVLSLHGNELDCLPVEFSNLKKITKLVLSDNNFKSLPNAIGSLSELEVCQVTLPLVGNTVLTMSGFIFFTNSISFMDKNIILV